MCVLYGGALFNFLRSRKKGRCVMDVKEIDEKIKDLLEYYLDCQFASIPPENEISYGFSDGFNKKMQILIDSLKKEK